VNLREVRNASKSAYLAVPAGSGSSEGGHELQLVMGPTTSSWQAWARLDPCWQSEPPWRARSPCWRWLLGRTEADLSVIRFAWLLAALGRPWWGGGRVRSALASLQMPITAAWDLSLQFPLLQVC